LEHRPRELLHPWKRALSKSPSAKPLDFRRAQMPVQASRWTGDIFAASSVRGPGGTRLHYYCQSELKRKILERPAKINSVFRRLREHARIATKSSV
jgi:hypothetical protein